MKILLIAYSILLSIGLIPNNIINSYSVSEEYSIRFTTKKVNGTFHGLGGVVDFNESNIENSYVAVSVEVASILTGNKTKDRHARNSKWFNAKKYPRIEFMSESIIKKGAQYQLTGLLNIKDVSLKHQIDFTTETVNDETYLIGSTIINRELYNIKGNIFGGFVGKDVTVDLRIPSKFGI